MIVAGFVPKTGGRSRLIEITKQRNREAILQEHDHDLISDAKWVKFWDLMDTVNVHGYIRAAMGVIGRSTVGAWWTLRKHKEFKSSARALHRRKLVDFYMFSRREWDNIKDFYGMSYKLMIAAMYLRYFGFCAFQIIRDMEGNPIGLDFMHGYVIPNVDEEGFFQSPAFIQYPNQDKEDFVEYNDPLDIVYITNPDWEGYPQGSSDIQALADYALPLDLHLQTAAREYMQNRNTPEAYYVLSPDISDDAFDEFVESIEARYAGPTNIGRNPVAVAGELKIVTVSKIPSDLPYQTTRDSTVQETLAVSGVSGSKLGMAEDMTNSNLREMRREFHETSMLPLFRFIEEGFYEQIHVREFGYVGWEFSFNSPDFLTAVERATVNMREYGIGVVNPNEIRTLKGLDPREDPGGDMYIDQLLNAPSVGPNTPPAGSPPEGREDEPDAPGEIGEPTLDDQDPPRGDQHDEEGAAILGEVRRFRRFAAKRLEENRVRPFASDVLPDLLLHPLNKTIMSAKSAEEALQEIDFAIGELEEFYHGEKSY